MPSFPRTTALISTEQTPQIGKAQGHRRQHQRKSDTGSCYSLSMIQYLVLIVGRSLNALWTVTWISTSPLN